MLSPIGVTGSQKFRIVAALLGIASVLLFTASPVQAASGDFDTTFGSNGIAPIDFGGSGSVGSGAHAVIQLSSGSIIAAGIDKDGIMAVSRLTPTGALDTTFGLASTGTVTIGLPNAVGGIAQAVIEQPDHKIVIAGMANDYLSTGYTAIAVVRLDENGNFDGTFGVSGMVIADIGIPLETRALVRQPDGKLLIAGGINGTIYGFTVIRLLSNGAFDSSFNAVNGGGYSVASFGACSGNAEALALQPSDGKIVVAGTIDCTATGKSIGFARFNSDGTLDPSFSADGITSLPQHPTYTFADVRGIVLRPDGRIVAAGRCHTASNSWFALVALDTDGNFYSSFAGNGIQCYASSPLVSAFPAGLVQQSDGKLVIAGTATTIGYVAFMRVSADGILDTSFGASSDGTALSTTVAIPYALALQSDGYLLTAGEIFSQNKGIVIRVVSDVAAGSAGRIGFRPYSQYTSGEYIYESDGSVTLYVGRVNGSTGVVTVDYATANGSAIGGSDFVADSGTLTWADSETGDKAITVQIIQDGATEQAESFTIVLSNATGGAVLTNSVGNVIICDPTNGCGSTTGGGGGGSTGFGNSKPNGCPMNKAYAGTQWEGDLRYLRAFRDKHLMTNSLGRALVRFYYEIGPSAAGYLAEHDTAQAVFRVAMLPALKIAKLIVATPADGVYASQRAPHGWTTITVANPAGFSVSAYALPGTRRKEV